MRYAGAAVPGIAELVISRAFARPVGSPGLRGIPGACQKILVVMSGRRVLARPLAEKQSSSPPRAAQGETDEQEHDLPLVQSRRRRSRAVLCQDVPQQQRR